MFSIVAVAHQGASLSGLAAIGADTARSVIGGGGIRVIGRLGI